MLKLHNIVKTYDMATRPVQALKGVSIAFRPCEFVAILGQSGCGKTTLLNIIGGLDRYTSGDLVIRGKSTKQYKDRDWDTYRNHSVGFVFQSYNLIPHQSILANVELALTLSGIKKAERRRRAKEALQQVGLGDQIHKKPNQLSGGQMQRVAIARALVNDPEILLADEPTGALDSETSLQVMDLLKEIAKNRLVIMVTHNPELAQQYANRIVRLLDGQIIDDSNPYAGETQVTPSCKQGRASMSFLTAFALSMSNLLTKKGRTLLTAFAGSIGIIGIALILSLSTGFDKYISDIEKDTLSSYPLTLESQVIDMSSMMASMRPNQDNMVFEEDKIYSSNIMSGMMDMMLSSATNNNLTGFKEFIDSGNSGLEELTSEIRYLYSTPLNIYKADLSDGIYKVNPSDVFNQLGMQTETQGNMMNSMGGMMSNNVWTQLTTNRDLLEQQYEVVAGTMPNQWNEVVLVVSEDNRITDYTLYALGILDIDELKQALKDTMAGKDPEIDTTVHEYSYEDFLGMKFKLLPSSSYYQEQNGKWVDMSKNEIFLTDQLQKAEDVTVVGILRPASDAAAAAAGVIGYTGELMTELIDMVNNSEIVKAQIAAADTDIFTGLPFADPDAEPTIYTLQQIQQEILPTLPPETQTQLGGYIAQMQGAGMPDSQIAATVSKMLAGASSESTYEDNLTKLGVSDLEKPSAINIYPIDFASKDKITEIIDNYNKSKEEADQLTYTDYVGLMMSSITTVINAISYILIAFVAISLVVSSIMIGIITNISVLERTKEIGILRAVGASKRDVKRVFNAETFIVGLSAGLVGIGVTELLMIPINLLLEEFVKISARAYLPAMAAVILVGISVFLTFIAGLIPASNAAKKDPVVALRTE